MNRTQKGAWFCLGITVLLIAFSVIVFISMVRTGLEKLVLLWILLIFGFMVVSAIFLCKKQSPTEVAFDERDNFIKKKAIRVSFISLLILLFAAGIVPWFIVGDSGSIPGCFLPLINFNVFLIVMLIYSVAVLVQYGWGNKSGE